MSPKSKVFRPVLPAKLKDEARSSYLGGRTRGGTARRGGKAAVTPSGVVEPKGHFGRGGPGLSSVGRGGWSRVRSRKEERKAARLEKKRKRLKVPQKSAAALPVASVKRKQPEEQGEDQGRPKKQQAQNLLRKSEVNAVSGRSKKRAKLDPSSGESARDDLDPNMKRMKEGVKAEEKLQKALAKRLKMKMSAMKATDISDLLPGFDNEDDFGLGSSSSSSDDEPDLEEFQRVEVKKFKKQQVPGQLAAGEDFADIIQSDSESKELLEAGSELSDLEESDLDSDDDMAEDVGGLSDRGQSDSGDDQNGGEVSEEDSQEGIPVEDTPLDDALQIAPKYVPPALRNQQSAQKEAVERRVRSLLNKVVEGNVQAVVAEVVEMYSKESRSIVCGTLVEEIIKAAARGPKATDQFVGIAAALLAGTSGSASAQDLAANFLAQLAIELERSYANDDALGCQNMVTLFCHCYLCDLVGTDVVYDFLDVLTGRFKERDIIMMYALLQACGLRLRAEDPVGMKDFVVRIHERAGQAGKEGKLSSQGEIMLDLVLDIKNNRKKDRGTASKFKHLSEGVGKWLKETGVGNVKLGALTWQKLISPNKRGLWWLPEPGKTLESRVVNSIISNSKNAPGGMELLALATALRMTTDTRRAIFCVVMGSEDFLDAFNRLLGLPLKGNQQHEVVRVIVECCLHEKNWNPFYSHLIIKLCAAGIAGHKTTLQYCLWDRFSQVNDMEMRKMDNLTRLTAAIIAAKVLPVKMCKVVDFVSMEGRSLLFWRIALSRTLLSFKHSDQCVQAFAKLSITDATKALQKSMLLFFRNKLGPWVASLDGNKVNWVSKDQLGVLLKRVRSVEGVLSSDNRIV